MATLEPRLLSCLAASLKSVVLPTPGGESTKSPLRHRPCCAVIAFTMPSAQPFISLAILILKPDMFHSLVMLWFSLYILPHTPTRQPPLAVKKPSLSSFSIEKAECSLKPSSTSAQSASSAIMPPLSSRPDTVKRTVRFTRTRISSQFFSRHVVSTPKNSLSGSNARILSNGESLS